MTIFENVLRQYDRYITTHAYKPAYLVIEPETAKQLFDEMCFNNKIPWSNAECTIMNMQIVIVPIPELFYIAGYPEHEIFKHDMKEKSNARRS